MSRETLYVANLAPSLDETLLRELFGEYGEVVTIEFGAHRLTGESYALVQMTIEKNATQAYHGLNGRRIDDHCLAVSYPEIDLTRALLPKQRKIAEAIAAELGETEEKPLRMINAMVLLCGTSFAQAIANEAKEIESAGGLTTSDGERQRTLGGIFFYLARHRMPDEMRKIIYNRKGKLPLLGKETPLINPTP